MSFRIRTAYDRRLADGRLTPDPSQVTVVEALGRLEADLEKRGLFGARPEVRGVYLWGPPGRGKSILMDLFFASAPEERKVRAHFHAFMARIHDLIGQWRKGDKKARQAVFGTHKGDDPIEPVADLIASEARLLCFDELQVTDIADAMILGRLFEALFEKKVVLAVTSNRAPDQLYLNGINRQLFLPFIDMIEAKCEVRAGFEALWSDLKGDQHECPTHLTVLGRDVVVERTDGGMARATFEELCGRPLGPQDYLAVAGRFHTVFIEAVPVLGPANHHEARRFVTLIDALYEAKTRLVALAAAPPEALYTEGVGAFEFERTVSRLNEMASADWLEHERAA